MKTSVLRNGVLQIFVVALLCSAHAAPRPPAPPWPEQTLAIYGWDAELSLTGRQAAGEESAILVESWSGYALTRDALAMAPVVVPVVGDSGRLNVSPTNGAIRFWFRPDWSSSSTGGNGPGYCTRLLELINAQTANVHWSLYLSEKGNTIYLSGQTRSGVTDLLEASVEFQTNQWRLITLCYSPTNTVLFVDGERIAEGGGVLAPTANEVATLALAVGSDINAGNTADGQFEELTTFDYWPDTGQQQFYFNGMSPQVALGPLTPEEEEEELEGGGAMMMNMLFAPTSEGCDCAPGGQVYITNFVATLNDNETTTVSFCIEGGTVNVAYDIFATSDLTTSITNTAQWTWLGQGYTCNTYTFTNQPMNLRFYGLAVPEQTMVVAWGDNISGQCNVPEDLTNAIDIAAGYDFSLALLRDGTVRAWGDNTYGQTNVPPGLSNVVKIAANWNDALALKSDGTAVHWGNSIYSVPGSATNLSMIAMGSNYALALQTNGMLLSWGQPSQTNLMSGLTNIISIAAATDHKVVVQSNGLVFAWGSNDLGQLNVPSDLTNAVAVSAANLHSLALRNDNTVAAWGWNDDGQTNVPTGLSNVVSVAAGGWHSLALEAVGTVVAWGDTAPVPSGLTGVKAIAAGYGHSLALRTGSLTPVIMAQPTGPSWMPGSNVTFSITASGCSPLSYQWYFNTNTIANATNASLTLTNTQTTNMGEYYVVIYSPCGSVTSSPAYLGDPDWSFVQMGDLHAGYVLWGPSFTNAINTLISNKAAWNIKMFISAGDLYENDANFSFFTNAPGKFCAANMTNQLWRLRSNGISVMAVEGNHEEKYAHESPYPWNSIFGTNFYASEPMHFTNRVVNDTRDFAMKLTNGASKYLFIGLGWVNNPDTNYTYAPMFVTTNDMIAAYSNSCVWAKNLASSFSNHQVIAACHYFVDTNGVPSTKDKTSSPDNPTNSAGEYVNIGPGIALWNQLKTLPNPILVLSGHVRTHHMTVSTLTADDGHTVQSVKLNTQNVGEIIDGVALNNGGTFVLYTVQPALQRVSAKVYAVEIGRFFAEGEGTNRVYTPSFNFPTQ